jgi:hypothetical protein
MSEQRVLTLELPEADYSRLAAAAHRAGVPAETLVRTAISRLLRQGARDPRRSLEVLGQSRATLPATDAVEIVQHGRSVLDARASG